MSELNSQLCHCCNGTGQENTLDDDVRIGAELRSLRLKAGYSGRKIAKKMGVSEAYISMLENGRRHFNPSFIKEFRRLCK